MTSPWHSVVGHADQIAMLRNASRRGRLGHTLLFAGPHGIGKRKVALALAQCLFCERHTEVDLEACGDCPACKQVQAGTHPDLLSVGRPEGKSNIPISLLLGDDEQRGKAGLCHDLALRPLAGTRKIAIIDEAEYLGDEAANALLKTLEEPPPGAILILTADAPESLLSTIRSRCQVLRFASLSTDELVPLILAHGLVADEPTARAIALLGDGSLREARTLVEPQLRAHRETLFTALAQPKFDPVTLAQTLWAAIEDSTSDVPGQRLQSLWIARFGGEFFRQVLRCLAGHAIPSEEPRTFAGRLTLTTPDAIDRVGLLLDRCFAAEGEIDGNATVALWLEVFLQSLGRIARSGE